MSLLFRQHNELEAQVNDYLDLVVHSGVLFRSALQLVLQDRPDEFHGRLRELHAVSRQASERRWDMTSRFCRPTVMARPRSDLAAFLESTETLMRRMHATLVKYAVEQPEPALDGNTLLVELAEAVKVSIDSMAAAVRSHLRNTADASEQADRARQAREHTSLLGEKYRRMIFRMDLRLSHKNQLCAFAEAMERIADGATDAADQMAVSGSGRRSTFNVWALGQVATGWLVLSIVAVVVTFVATLFAS